MKVTGNRSYCYCEYCLIQGVWNRGLYCPITPPIDTPLEAQTRKGSGYPWIEWDRSGLPMRNDIDFQRAARQVARKGATAKQKSKYGVKGLSILSRLSSIDFPRSFPPDSMHLWFENIIPDLVKQWRGKFRVDAPEASDGGSVADNESSDTEITKSESNAGENIPNSKRRKTNKQKWSSQRLKRNKKGKERKKTQKEPKAIATDDEYNIKPQDWEEISQQIANSASTFPLLFGPLLRNLIAHIHEMTAAEWQLFTFLLGPVYLKDLLPDEDYKEFLSLVEGIAIACDYVVTEADLVELEQRMEQFSKYYERRYYRLEWLRLKSCLPVFHQILHVSQALRWAGPMYVYSQWGMERLCGTFASMAKSRVATNRNLSNTLIMVEQKNSLIYTVSYGTLRSSDEDSDGNIRLSNFLAKKLKTSHLDNTAPTPNTGRDTLIFCGPSRVRGLTTYERMCLKAYILDELTYQDIAQEEEALQTEANSLEIPTHCRTFRAALFNTRQRGDTYVFKSTSSTAQRSNQTRSTAYIRFELLSRQGCKESSFAEVLFFFTVNLLDCSVYTHTPDDSKIKEQIREQERGPIRDAQEDEILLAFVRHFSVNKDGRLLYRHNKGVLRVIRASDIHELIGLLWKQEKQYIVRKHTALF